MAFEPTNQLTSSSPALSTAEWLRGNQTRLLQFACVGLSGVFVNLAAANLAFFLIFAPFLQDPFLLIAANALGFLTSVFTNFLLNDHFTWGDRRKGSRRHWFRRLGKYYLAASGGGAVQIIAAPISLAIFWTHLDLSLFGLHLSPTLSILTGIAAGLSLNFLASHLWAFRDAPLHQGP